MSSATNHEILIDTPIALIEEILAPWKMQIGADFDGYKNHVYRMVHCCFALRPAPISDVEKQKVCIAACFHDIGLWVRDTLDYIPPSLPPAEKYLQENGLSEWTEEIKQMISEHHKLTKCDDKTYPLVELFRRADLVDFSLGIVRAGLPRHFIVQLKSTFPNAGFHRMLLRRSLRWFVRHPLNPAPMMKW